MASFFNMFDFSGDPGEPDYFYDQSEFDSSKADRDRYLGDVKSDRGRYRRDRNYWRGQERSQLGQAERLFGRGEQAIDSSGRYIGRAGMLTDRASSLATDGSYRDTAQRVRGKADDLERLQGDMAGIRSRMDRPVNVGNSKFSAIARDALTSWYQSQKEELDTQLAGSSLAPAAQAALKERMARGMLENVGRAEIQGVLSQEDADMRKFLSQTQMIGAEANLAQSGIGAILNEQDVRRSQQQDLRAAASGQLNVAQAGMARGQALGSMGGQYAQLGGMSGANTRFYDQSQQAMTSELLGDARDRMSTQQQLQMSDAANRQAYNTYKAQSGQRGFSNLMKIGSTVARLGAAFYTGGASLAAEAAMTAAESAGNKAGESNQVYDDAIMRQRRTGRGGSYGGHGGSHGNRSYSLASRARPSRLSSDRLATPRWRGYQQGDDWVYGGYGGDVRGNTPRGLDKNSYINDIQY